MPWLGIILVLFLVGIVLAIRFLPWWGLVIMVAIPILGWRYIGAGIMAIMLRRTARAMSKVLHEATVTIHSLRAVPPPDPTVLEERFKEDPDDEDDAEFRDQLKDMPDEPPEDRDWYELEVTIAPKPQERTEDEDTDDGWQPDALVLVVPEAEWGEYDVTCMVGRIEMEQDGQMKPVEDRMVLGPKRLKLLLGVTPGTRRLAFRYFFYSFGDVIELGEPLIKERGD